MNPVHSQLAQQAEAHLRLHDPILAPVINQTGPCTIMPHDNYYQELVESIIGQQLNVKAAATINRRFVELFDGRFPLPEQILHVAAQDLRSAGLSRAKVSYIQNLAQHIVAGELEITALPSLTNEKVIAELTAVKGIGEWTAHMFLIFSLGRLNVLPVGDLGVRTGIMRLYTLPSLPDADTMRQIAAQGSWHPYESVASWYIWQALDNAPKS